MSGDSPGYAPWPSVRVVITLLGVALVAFIGSFLVPGPTTDVVRVITIKPISTTAGQPRTVPLPHSNSKRASYDLNLRFRFRIDSMRTAETLFHVGSAKTGVTASISEPVDGYRYVVLSAPRFSAVLVNHVVAGQTYAVTVSIDNGGTSITATVDGQRPFSYNYLASSPTSSQQRDHRGPGKVHAANHGQRKIPPASHPLAAVCTASPSHPRTDASWIGKRNLRAANIGGRGRVCGNRTRRP